MLWERRVSAMVTSADEARIEGNALQLVKILDGGVWGKTKAIEPILTIENLPSWYREKVSPAVLRGLAAACTSGDKVTGSYYERDGVGMVLATIERSGPRQPTIQLILAARPVARAAS